MRDAYSRIWHLGVIYVLAFVGIVCTVFKEPVSTFLATSGVLAIVLGPALQTVPWAITMKPSAFTAASYWITLSFGTPIP